VFGSFKEKGHPEIGMALIYLLAQMLWRVRLFLVLQALASNSDALRRDVRDRDRLDFSFAPVWFFTV